MLSDSERQGRIPNKSGIRLDAKFGSNLLCLFSVNFGNDNALAFELTSNCDQLGSQLLTRPAPIHA